MSAFSIAIDFNEQDRAAFDAQMRRFTLELGKAPQEAVRWGMLALLRSMRASTKKAPPRRKVRASRSARNRRVGENRIFYAVGLDRSTGGAINIPIFAPDLATAKMSPRARIKRHGLARDSWGWAAKRLFGAASAATVQPLPNGAIETTLAQSPRDGYAGAFVTNKLDYIAAALAGGRGPAVSTAMARAAATMRARIDLKINQATREAGY